MMRLRAGNNAGRRKFAETPQFLAFFASHGSHGSPRMSRSSAFNVTLSVTPFHPVVAELLGLAAAAEAGGDLLALGR